MINLDSRLRVAILPFGSQIGSAYVDALKFEKDLDLIGMTSGRPVISNRGLEARVDGLPCFDRPNFVGSVKQALARFRVDLLYPANDFVAHALSVAGFNDKTLRFDSKEDRSWIFNKSEVYQRLEGDISLPKRVKLHRRSLPLFARPALGARSVGASPVSCVHSLRLYRKSVSEHLFTEVLEGPETTVDCLSDSNGKLLAVLPRRRCAVRDGVTTQFESVVLSPEIAGMAHQLCDALGFVGQWFFQTKEDCRGRVCFLEASPRASGGSEFWGLFGINLPLIDLYIRLGHDVVVPPPLKPIVYGRKVYQTTGAIAFEPDHVFVDFDDTLVGCDGTLRGSLIGRLVDLRAQQAELHILSRSTATLETKLETLGVRGLFNQIIQVKNGAPKSAQIFGSRPLFIDDSFAERQEVGLNSSALALSPSQVINLEFV